MLASLLWYTQANLNTKSQQAFNNACEKTFTRNRKSAISFLPLNCSLAAICFSFSRDCESDSFFLSYSDVPPICQGNYGRGQIVIRILLFHWMSFSSSIFSVDISCIVWYVLPHLLNIWCSIMSVRTVRVYWKMTALGVQRLNDSQTLSSVHVVILFMWRFASGIVALKKSTALCIALMFYFLLFVLGDFCLAAAPRHFGHGVQIRGKLKKWNVSSVVRSKQWIPSGKIWFLNTIMYSIYRLQMRSSSLAEAVFLFWETVGRLVPVLSVAV